MESKEVIAAFVISLPEDREEYKYYKNVYINWLKSIENLKLQKIFLINQPCYEDYIFKKHLPADSIIITTPQHTELYESKIILESLIANSYSFAQVKKILWLDSSILITPEFNKSIINIVNNNSPAWNVSLCSNTRLYFTGLSKKQIISKFVLTVDENTKIIYPSKTWELEVKKYSNLMQLREGLIADVGLYKRAMESYKDLVPKKVFDYIYPQSIADDIMVKTYISYHHGLLMKKVTNVVRCKDGGLNNLLPPNFLSFYKGE